jgi:general secretion pathway protein G
MAILGVLALMAIPAYSKIKDTARAARAVGEIHGIEQAVYAFTIDKGRLPTDAEYQSGIGQGTLVDPWGNAYVYHMVNGGTGRPGDLGENLNDDFDLYSSGADGTSDPSAPISDPQNLDDVVRAGDGGYIGLGKNYAF